MIASATLMPTRDGWRVTLRCQRSRKFSQGPTQFVTVLEAAAEERPTPMQAQREAELLARGHEAIDAEEKALLLREIAALTPELPHRVTNFDNPAA